VTPRLSIILPVYDGLAYLGESLDSVLSQTLPDFEVIVWDDGSHDDPTALVSARRDPRVRFFRSEINRGLFPTLNLALERARGELLRFWSQDDRMKPDCLAREMAFWARHPDIAMSYCQRDLIDQDGRVILRAPWDPTPEVVPPWLSAQISYYHNCMPGSISTVTVRKRVVLDVGRFRPLRVSGDFEMWTRIGADHPIGFVRESLVELRSHPAQLSRRAEAGLEFVRENRPIFAELLSRLPGELQRYARRFHRRRAVWYVHYTIRAALSGDLALARAALREVAREGNVWALSAEWAATLNGRLFAPAARYLEPFVRDDGSAGRRPWHPDAAPASQAVAGEAAP